LENDIFLRSEKEIFMTMRPAPPRPNGMPPLQNYYKTDFSRSEIFGYVKFVVLLIFLFFLALYFINK